MSDLKEALMFGSALSLSPAGSSLNGLQNAGEKLLCRDSG